MCAYEFNCCWLLCVLSLFSSLLTLAPPPYLCRLPSPMRRPSSGSRRPSLGLCLPLDCADLPLIALRCLVCFGKSKKKESNKKKENKVGTHTTKKIGCLILADLFFTGLPLPFQKKCVWWLALLYYFVHIISLWVSPEKKRKKPEKEKKRKKGQRRKQAAYPFSDFLCYPPTNLAPTLHFVSSSFAQVLHYNSTLHYCLIVLILDLSAAYPELYIFLRREDFVSPGNRSSNLSRVPPVGCSSPMCAW